MKFLEKLGHRDEQKGSKFSVLPLKKFSSDLVSSKK